MTWTIPQPYTITERYHVAYQAAFPGIQSRKANSFTGVQARVHGEVMFDPYLYQRSLADEMMIDTAMDWLPRHANTWNVPQETAKLAVGNVIFANLPTGTALPAEIEVVDNTDGTQWVTTSTATVGSDGTASAPVQAEEAGASGNRDAGTVLTIISTVLNLQLDTVTVDSDGLAGGTDIEAIPSWRARILQRVRERGAGGNTEDYEGWAEDAGVDPAYTNVVPSWVGPGSVGIVVMMPNPAGGAPLVPSPSQISAIQASIDGVRPVTAQAVVVAGALLPLNITLALKTDTVAARNAAQAAAASYLLSLGTGGLLEQDLLEDAMIQAAGTGAKLSVPADDVQAGNTQVFQLGTPTFVTYTT